MMFACGDLLHSPTFSMQKQVQARNNYRMEKDVNLTWIKDIKSWIIKLSNRLIGTFAYLVTNIEQ
jgi:hypothetical protein